MSEREHPVKCLVCHADDASRAYGSDLLAFDCPACGAYKVSGSVERQSSRLERIVADPLQRAQIQYALRSMQSVSLGKDRIPMITSATLDSVFRGDVELPLPPQQARNLLKVIGDHQRCSGQHYTSGRDLAPRVGAVTDRDVLDLINWLVSCGQLNGDFWGAEGGHGGLRLTIAGWEEWELITRGRRSGRNGFIAMKFGDPRLDHFVQTVIKEGVKERLGVDVLRVDDEPEAGLIDNIMRRNIQEAAFVIVDLTHGNRGAYWEAGYAEGLGKPVIYICEQSVFEDGDPETKPHFDVNHSTTLFWSDGDGPKFLDRLVATIVNSAPHVISSA